MGGGAIATNTFGRVVRNMRVPGDVVEQILADVDDLKLTPVLIGGDNFWCVARSEWSDWLVEAGDPEPKGVGKKGLLRKSERTNLVCLMGSKDAIDAALPTIKSLIKNFNAHIVRPFE